MSNIKIQASMSLRRFRCLKSPHRHLVRRHLFPKLHSSQKNEMNVYLARWRNPIHLQHTNTLNPLKPIKATLLLLWKYNFPHHLRLSRHSRQQIVLHYHPPVQPAHPRHLLSQSPHFMPPNLLHALFPPHHPQLTRLHHQVSLRLRLQSLRLLIKHGHQNRHHHQCHLTPHPSPLSSPPSMRPGQMDRCFPHQNRRMFPKVLHMHKLGDLIWTMRKIYMDNSRMKMESCRNGNTTIVLYNSLHVTLGFDCMKEPQRYLGTAL